MAQGKKAKNYFKSKARHLKKQKEKGIKGTSEAFKKYSNTINFDKK